MSVNIYSVPSAEPLYSEFEVFADGQRVPVRMARVSSIPYNRRWPGHQRQIEQSELSGFINFSFEGSVEIKIIPRKKFTAVCVKPYSKGIVPVCKNDEISFTLKERGGYSVELDGYHNNLHIFADSAEDTARIADFNIQDENTIYFGAGIHRPGNIELKSNQTLVIDEGAVVYCCVSASDAENIRIIGKGLIDNSENREEILFEVEQLGSGMTDVGNSKRLNTIDIKRCNNVYIDGITVRDSLVYNVSAHGCNDCTVRNIKLIGCWRYNSDGIDFHNSCRIRISDCFVRTFDDSICVKGHNGYQDICEDIVVDNCVVWCDWDHALEIGAETRAKHMKTIVFRNCDVIHSVDIALDIFNVDYGEVHDVLFSDIRVELDGYIPRPRMQANDEEKYIENPPGEYISTLIACAITKHHEYSGRFDERGKIYDITYENIAITAPEMPIIFLHGYDAEHKVSNIKYINITLNGKRVEVIASLNEFAEQMTEIE